MIETCSDFSKDMSYFQAVCIGNQIITFGKVLGEYQTKMLTYNNETSEWTLIDYSFSKYKISFSSVKYHGYFINDCSCTNKPKHLFSFAINL